jgi:hypothetical protein
LGTRLLCEQTLGCGVVIAVNFVNTRPDINGDELVVIFRTKGGADISVIDLLPSPGKLFGAEKRLARNHGFSPDWFLASCLQHNAIMPSKPNLTHGFPRRKRAGELIITPAIGKSRKARQPFTIGSCLTATQVIRYPTQANPWVMPFRGRKTVLFFGDSPLDMLHCPLARIGTPWLF